MQFCNLIDITVFIIFFALLKCLLFHNINSQHNVLYYGLVMNNVCVTSCYELEMLDEHTASLFNLLIYTRTEQKQNRNIIPTRQKIHLI